MARGRKKNTEIGYVDSYEEGRGFTPHLNALDSKRIDRYCKLKNLNKTKFVSYCVNKVLDDLEKTIYESMSKEELIEILLSMKEGSHDIRTDSECK